jgi:hypothetical protein
MDRELNDRGLLVLLPLPSLDFFDDPRVKHLTTSVGSTPTISLPKGYASYTPQLLVFFDGLQRAEIQFFFSSAFAPALPVIMAFLSYLMLKTGHGF